MELFNKYKNKDFTYITNYINRCINDDSVALTPEQLVQDLLGSSQNTFEEFINALLNHNENGLDSKNPNAELLYLNNNSYMQPIRENYVPIRTSLAEKAWLYYVLKNHKSALFIPESTRNDLCRLLEKNFSFPDFEHCIDTRELSCSDQSLLITPEYVTSFQTIVTAISEHKQLQLTNHAYSGDVYENQTVIPYKLEYSPQFDSFSLSAYPLDTKRPVKMNLNNLSNLKIGKQVEDYDNFVHKFENLLNKARITEPIILEITNDRNGYDRCSYKFSSYDKVCYENEDGDLIMKLFYYRFQKDEILRNVLFLGPSVKIVSPTEIVDEYITILKEAYKAYGAEV